MKQLSIFSILFCLVFLNVPRSLVHECHHNSEVHKKQSNSSPDKDLSFDADDCFACEFVLDYAELSTPFEGQINKVYAAAFVRNVASKYIQEKFNLFSLRGPPKV